MNSKEIQVTKHDGTIETWPARSPDAWIDLATNLESIWILENCLNPESIDFDTAIRALTRNYKSFVIL